MRPVINVLPTINVYIGMTAAFYCNVTAANPKPTITWKDSSNKVLEYGYVLHLKEVEKSQSGAYTCQASNGIGLPVTKTTTLIVKGMKH